MIAMFTDRLFGKHSPRLGGLDILKFIGPGFLVTVGFIDPGNWATNIAAGSYHGYALLWVVTLSTLMLIILQHNAAHLGIVTGLCLAESSTKFFGRMTSRLFLSSALAAAVSTALAEILGAAIGLNMLLHIPIRTGALMTALAAGYLLFSNNYKKLERWIIAIVSVIGFSFLFELSLVNVGWKEAAGGWVMPSIPKRSLPLVMSILGAVVMPHNLFLHSEIIQSRQMNIRGDAAIEKQLKYEFTDTLFAMLIGWGINSAIIIMAASVFFDRGILVTDLMQADATLKPLLGGAAGIIFGLALLLSGFSSSVTAAMAGGSIFSGMFGEPFDISDSHSRTGAAITLTGAVAAAFLLNDFFQGIIWSQIILSIQLPWSIFFLVRLTSSSRAMGKFSNSLADNLLLWSTAIIVSGLNVVLFASMI
ncbi:Mn2+ and fe2+ transporters of the nramp family [Candidatus Sulfobium mesophilum]|uniref:Mn2+ and fe2+ transporters of the nramp family n=1 Tax=Candidatus Sulfobium mesophilum TaxID=2016548 RepID=A0A2U3QF88_9BACT|nr:Mn2+ and fe2+ transporters of the nramp family [Candidatus Sulfobium mesophilum]